MTIPIFHSFTEAVRVHPRLSKRNGERLRAKEGRTASFTKILDRRRPRYRRIYLPRVAGAGPGPSFKWRSRAREEEVVNTENQ